MVGRGAADRLFVNTAGIGVVPAGVAPAADRARPGDVVIVSGPIGLHGVAIMSVREGLEFEVEIASDTQALNGLVAAILGVDPDVHVLRDPTRGGLSSALNEIAATSGVGMVLDEPAIPIPGPVRAACEMLGLDPLHVANEGKLIAVVPAASADAVVAAMRTVPQGAGAVRIGSGSSLITPEWSPSARSSGASGSWTCWSGSSCPGSAGKRAQPLGAGLVRGAAGVKFSTPAIAPPRPPDALA